MALKYYSVISESFEHILDVGIDCIVSMATTEHCAVTPSLKKYAFGSPDVAFFLH